MSPEYAMFGQFSEKSDVYSFGVMILEIISGKKNMSSHESHHVADGLLNFVSAKILLFILIHHYSWVMYKNINLQV